MYVFVNDVRYRVVSYEGFFPMGRWVAEIRTQMAVTNNIILVSKL